jgi:hypothetical protein
LPDEVVNTDFANNLKEDEKEMVSGEKQMKNLEDYGKPMTKSKPESKEEKMEISYSKASVWETENPIGILNI